VQVFLVGGSARHQKGPQQATNHWLCALLNLFQDLSNKNSPASFTLTCCCLFLYTQVVLVEGLARRQKGPNGAGWYQRAQTIAAQAQAAFAAAAAAAEGEGVSAPEVCCHSPECEGWGVHHTKAFVLAYADGGVRVVVHTANLLFGDCNSKTQGLWWQVRQLLVCCITKCVFKKRLAHAPSQGVWICLHLFCDLCTQHIAGAAHRLWWGTMPHVHHAARQEQGCYMDHASSYTAAGAARHILHAHNPQDCTSKLQGMWLQVLCSRQGIGFRV
jgi:hypothetical protein